MVENTNHVKCGFLNKWLKGGNKGYHKGTVILPKTIHRGMRFKDAAFMGIMRWAFYNRLKELYASKNISVSMTYGYITKNTRIEYGLSKAK